MSTTAETFSKDDENQVLDALRVWLDKEVRPVVKYFDHEDEYPHEIVAQMKEMGLFGLMYAPENVGLGMSASAYAKVITLINWSLR